MGAERQEAATQKADAREAAAAEKAVAKVAKREEADAAKQAAQLARSNSKLEAENEKKSTAEKMAATKRALEALKAGGPLRIPPPTVSSQPSDVPPVHEPMVAAPLVQPAEPSPSPTSVVSETPAAPP